MPLKKAVKVSKFLGLSKPTPIPATDSRPHFTPADLAARWRWHAESVRRAIREGRISSMIIGRRRLIAASEVERIEREGFIARAA
jgi:hypothetical protein